MNDNLLAEAIYNKLYEDPKKEGDIIDPKDYDILGICDKYQQFIKQQKLEYLLYPWHKRIIRRIFK